MAQSSTTLFVGNLSVFTTARDLYSAFQHFGETEVRMKRGNEGRSNCGFGFVEFQTRECAEIAKATMHGAVFMGRLIRVEWASESGDPKKDGGFGLRNLSHRSAGMTRTREADSVQVLVSFASRKIGQRVYEEQLFAVFSQFGAIEDIAIKKSNHHQMSPTGLHSGYCFITFPNSEYGIQSAAAAVRSVNNILVQDVLYDCRMSHALEHRLRRSPSGQRLLEEIDEIASASIAAAIALPPPAVQLQAMSSCSSPSMLSATAASVAAAASGEPIDPMWAAAAAANAMQLRSFSADPYLPSPTAGVYMQPTQHSPYHLQHQQQLQQQLQQQQLHRSVQQQQMQHQLQRSLQQQQLQQQPQQQQWYAPGYLPIEMQYPAYMMQRPIYQLPQP